MAQAANADDHQLPVLVHDQPVDLLVHDQVVDVVDDPPVLEDDNEPAIPEGDNEPVPVIPESDNIDPANAAADPVESDRDAVIDENDTSNSSNCSEDVMGESTTAPPVLETCPICFEPFTSMGEHRISALKCGHLFGVTCITRWLTVRGRRDGRCPQCNIKARKADIIVLYAASIKTMDTSEQERVVKELEREREIRRRLEMEFATSQLRYKHALAELKRLQGIVDLHTQSTSQSATMSRLQENAIRLELHKTVNICREGKCRVMVSMDYCAMLIISQPNLNPLFPGFGLKKLNSLEYRACEFIAIHSEQIRDIAHNANRMDALLLTASLDKRLKLTSMLSNSCVETFEAGCGVWSCAWNLDNPYQFFAGLANGSVLLFDTRRPSERVSELRCSDSRVPVISLQYVRTNSCSRLNGGGLLACQLDGYYFCEAKLDNDYRIHPLSIEKGPWTSMSFEPETCHMMMSCRPNADNRTVRHLVNELSQTPLNQEGKSICQSNVIQTFYGGSSHKTMSRSLLLRCPVNLDKTIACASNESCSSVIIWDVNNGSLLQRLPVPETVLDICPITVNGTQFLGTLTEKTLNVYRWKSL